MSKIKRKNKVTYVKEYDEPGKKMLFSIQICSEKCPEIHRLRGLNIVKLQVLLNSVMLKSFRTRAFKKLLKKPIKTKKHRCKIAANIYEITYIFGSF